MKNSPTDTRTFAGLINSLKDALFQMQNDIRDSIDHNETVGYPVPVALLNDKADLDEQETLLDAIELGYIQPVKAKA